jgi:hypothetical protein
MEIMEIGNLLDISNLGVGRPTLANDVLGKESV